MVARTFDIPRILADARAGTLSSADMRKAIGKAEDWGLSEAATQLKQLLSSRSAHPVRAARPAAAPREAGGSD